MVQSELYVFLSKRPYRVFTVSELLPFFNVNHASLSRAVKRLSFFREIVVDRSLNGCWLSVSFQPERLNTI